MTEKKKTGRPPKYTEEQVIRGIDIVEKSGEHPTGDTVKMAMVARLGVPETINAQCLDKEVARLVMELKRQREEQLIAELPEATRERARKISALVEAQLLVEMGDQHQQLRSVNATKLVERDFDLTNQRAQIRELLIEQDRLTNKIESLSLSYDEKAKQLEDARSENAILKARITELSKEQDIRAQMLALVRETLSPPQPTV